MGRLTQVDKSGNWSVKGLPWKKTYKGQVITEETRGIIYGALCKLKDFEEICEDPKQLERIDELFLEKCREVEELKRKVKKREWIPVEQRLPELHKEQINGGDYVMISDPVLATDGNAVAVLQYEIDDESVSGWVYDGMECERKITHWMPMPDPYRGDGEQ